MQVVKRKETGGHTKSLYNHSTSPPWVIQSFVFKSSEYFNGPKIIFLFKQSDSLKKNVRTLCCTYVVLSTLPVHSTQTTSFWGSSLGKCRKVEAFLGDGGFGFVTKCRSIETDKVVSIKAKKNLPEIVHQTSGCGVWIWHSQHREGEWPFLWSRSRLL